MRLVKASTKKGINCRRGFTTLARPFIRLNCAAISFDLLESELFATKKVRYLVKSTFAASWNYAVWCADGSMGKTK